MDILLGCIQVGVVILQNGELAEYIFLFDSNFLHLLLLAGLAHFCCMSQREAEKPHRLDADPARA
jgi:hypothetical protein